VAGAGGKQAGWMSSRYLAAAAPAQVSPQKAAVKSTGTRKAALRGIATRAEVKRAEKRIIRQSIAKFGGNCTCPYQRDRGGNLCGERSEWSNPRGYSPICYSSDISRRHLSHYFAKRGKTYRQ